MGQKKTGLGKGLSALINKSIDTELNFGNNQNPNISEGFIPNLPVGNLEPNPYQPRIEIKPDTLVELADSIREVGIIEPILVTKKQNENNKFEIIAGERRWRAAKLAGMDFVPVVVKESSPQEMLEIAIIENVQREDLNALEEALALEQLYKTFNLNHEEISKKVGISRSAVANKIRLLSLPEEIKKGLLEEKISEGHARAILGLSSNENMISAYKLILKEHLSVRSTEELVRRLNKGKNSKLRRSSRLIDERTVFFENKLKEKFGERISLARSQKGGKIVITFKSDDELNKIISELI